MISVAPQHREQIKAQAEAAYPAECCGLLAGRRAADGTVRVTRVVPSANVAPSPGHDRFEVDPQVRFALMRALDGTDEAIVGHYHSHPNHAAEPSATDVSMAFEPDLIWLIIPVHAQGAGAMRAWRLDREAGSVENVTLVTGESP